MVGTSPFGHNRHGSRFSVKYFLMFLGPPKTEAQLKKEAKKREKLEKFQQKKEMEAKKKMQPVAEVGRFQVTSNDHISQQHY